MLVVTRINLDEERIVACCVVAFNYFRYVLEFLDDFLVFAGVIKKQS